MVNDPAILLFCAMLGRDVFREFIMRMAQSTALGFLSICSAPDSGNDPEVVHDLVGAAVFLVINAEALITGAVLPVDGGHHTGGGVPCQT